MAGRVRASSSPVTARKAHSEATQEATLTRVSSRARRPKNHTPAARVGSRARSTVPIRRRVVSPLRMWGEEDVISFTDGFPPLRLVSPPGTAPSGGAGRDRCRSSSRTRCSR